MSVFVLNVVKSAIYISSFIGILRGVIHASADLSSYNNLGRGGGERGREKGSGITRVVYIGISGQIYIYIFIRGEK